MEEEYNYYVEAVVADPATAAWVLPNEVIFPLKHWLGFSYCAKFTRSVCDRLVPPPPPFEYKHDLVGLTEEECEAILLEESDRLKEHAKAEQRRGSLIFVPLYCATTLDTLYMWACLVKWFL